MTYGVLAAYEAVFGAARFDVADVSAPILDRATQLRARHGFRTPDAIHLATAIEASVDAFLTGDTALAKCPGLTVEIVSP